MTQAQALAAAQRLASIMEKYGVRCSIELQTGVAGSGWFSSVPRYAEMSHHTVSRRSQGSTPCLALVKRGRPDVPGPLCNGYMGYDEVYRIITMGWANHPGAGGPLTVAGATIPRDNARPYTWGTEFEGGLDETDFTPSYRSVMARANAAILEFIGRPIEAHIEHKTWAPARKIDRLGYTAASGQAEIRKYADATSTPTTEDDDDMPLYLAQVKGSNGIYVGDGITRRLIPNTTVLKDIQYKIQQGAFKGDPEVQVVDRIDWLGQEIPTPKVDFTATDRAQLEQVVTLVKDIHPTVQSRIPAIEALIAALDSPEVDVNALVTALAPLISQAVSVLSDGDVARVAEAAADELDRRTRARLDHDH